MDDLGGEFTRRRELSQTYAEGCNVMLGFLPCGDAVQDDGSVDKGADGRGKMSMFWSLDLSTVDAVRSDGIGAFKERVVALEPRSEMAVENHIKSFDDLIVAGYSDTFMPRYNHGSTVFIGDAAHATSPQLGQGANLALVDAWKLSESMKQCRHNVTNALEHYNNDRKFRLWFYQFNSRLLTPVFQSSSWAVGLLRNAFMGPLCQFPPTKRQMLTTLVGAQQNLWPYSTIPEEEFLGFITLREEELLDAEEKERSKVLA